MRIGFVSTVTATHQLRQKTVRFGDVILHPPTAADTLLTNEGASADFFERMRGFMQKTITPQILEDVIKDKYKIVTRDHLRQGHPEMHSDNDYTGGHHSRGTLGNQITIAEKIKDVNTGVWVHSRVWENALVHEIGHVTDYALGERYAKANNQSITCMSESPDFADAWMKDYNNIPDELKFFWHPDGQRNYFYYFLEPGWNGGYFRARQETWAEGLDILLRGNASSYNYNHFQQYFPESLKALKKILEANYGPLTHF